MLLRNNNYKFILFCTYRITKVFNSYSLTNDFCSNLSSTCNQALFLVNQFCHVHTIMFRCWLVK